MKRELNSETKTKLGILGKYIGNFESAVVAFSGGVDSTLLAYVAYQTLKDKLLTVTFSAPFIPDREIEESIQLAKDYKFPHEVIEKTIPDNDDFRSNNKNRCYVCKKAIFGELIKFAEERDYAAIFEGSNFDDSQVFRPGAKAIAELKVHSPLKAAGMTKQEIRKISEYFGLPTHDKPSYACLASRFPYGTKLNIENLKRVEKAEDYLFELGFNGHRVRDHFPIARVEMSIEDFEKLTDKQNRESIVNKLKTLGYEFVTLDLEGYRTGCYD